MIITIGGIKGGSGKTTVATHLTILRALQGHTVLLIDADDQETSTDFTQLRTTTVKGGAGYTLLRLSGHDVRTQTQRLAGQYDTIFIDTGGRDTASQRAALSVSTHVLVPFVPRSFDVWTLERVEGVIQDMKTVNSGLKAYAFLNRADARGQDNEAAASLLHETAFLQFLDTPLGYRKSFSNAAALGLCVTELKPSDPKATEEIMALYRVLFEEKSAFERYVA